MKLKFKIRDWLGLNSIPLQLDILAEHITLNRRFIGELGKRNTELKDDIALHNAALARIIAKLDPLYGLAEDDPRRKTASDDLGNAIIAKLKGEIEARNQHK